MFILWKAYYNILSYIIHAHPIDNIQPNAHICAEVIWPGKLKADLADL